MSYFNNIRKIIYQFPDNVRRLYTDISVRPKFRKIVLENSFNYEFYEIKEGDTPESIAYDRYGDPLLHWSIMIANDIMNVYTDWPKTQRQLDEYLFQKYKTQLDSDNETVTLTRTQVVEFIQFKGTVENDYTSYVTGTTVRIRPSHFIDTNLNVYTYDAIVNNTDNQDAFGRSIVYPTVTPVSIEEVEISDNESKRDIIIPKREIVRKALRELEEMDV